MAVLLVIALSYWPGLAGPFLFDDFGNLNVLGAFGPVDNWKTLLYYLSSGNADPTGRPIALLSFLIDAQSWPAEAWPFKRTNLVLHLLNTMLLGLAISRMQVALLQRWPEIKVSPWTPLLAATLWGAHPFFVSTTLYVVQREAMLPMTFVLLALLCWDKAVLNFAAQRNRPAWMWAIAGFGVATVLAGLSKANGFLAPLLVGLFHFYFLRQTHVEQGAAPPSLEPLKPYVAGQWRGLDIAATICLAAPSLLVVAYLAYRGWTLWSLPQLGGRDWTLPERLLSQPRALWSYVGQLALPRSGGGGIFVDNFAVSRNWFSPITTLPAALALGASVLGAVIMRQRFPILSFAWLFFLAAHLLESSVVPLELYFEHRNYLPAMLLGWPLAHALLRPGPYPAYRAAFAASLIATIVLLTHQRAVVWGDPALLSALSATYESDSARAQVAAARQEIDRGDVSAGLARIRAIQNSQSGSVDVAVSAIGIECAATGSVSKETLEGAKQTLSSSKDWNYGIYLWLQGAARDRALRRCEGFGLTGVSSLVSSAETNPQNARPSRKRDLWHVRGRIALANNQPSAALYWFDQSLRTAPKADYALVQAAALGDAGAPALGLEHLDRYQHLESKQRAFLLRDMASIHRWLLRRHGYYNNELSHLRGQLKAHAELTARSRTDG